jgi:hypothetical protein
VDHEAGLGELGHDRGLVEAARHRVGRAPAAVRVLQRGAGLGEVTRERAGQHDGVALGNQQAEHTTLAQHRRHRLQRLRRVVDDLEHPMAEHRVGARLARHLGQIRGITLDATHELADSLVGRPPLQRRQRVRARVDHGHPVTLDRQRHRESTGTSAEVHDVEPRRRVGPWPPGQCHPKSFGHQRRPQRTPTSVDHQNPSS